MINIYIYNKVFKNTNFKVFYGRNDKTEMDKCNHIFDMFAY